MSEIKYTFCRICESSCGLKFEVEGNQVIKVEPDNKHVGTEGFACMKGLLQHKMYDSPDRLKYPMKRNGSQWQRISWQQAFEEIGGKVRQLRQVSPHSIGMYVGTAAGFSMLHPIFAHGFMKGVGSRSIFSSATQDCANRFASASEMYGFPFLQPFPDLENINCLVIVGTNPVVSKWTFLQVANPVKRLKGMLKRGVKLHFVDPRRTESAKVGGEHVFIRPNTDVFFFLSFLHEIIARKAVDKQVLQVHMSGIDELEAVVEEWSPERTAEVTGISASSLRHLVSDYLNADGAAIITGTGIGMGTQGTLAHWLSESINAVTGNLDRKGGMVVGQGIFDFPKFGAERGLYVSDVYSRVGHFRAVNDGFPGGILADEILTPGTEQIKSLFVTGGNPLITMANSERLRDAFKELELLVVTDIYLNETASLAHYVLPATTPLERPDLPFIFPLFLGIQSKPYLAATDPVVEAKEEQLDEATIYWQLAKASGFGLFGSKIAQWIMATLARFNRQGNSSGQSRLPQRLLLSLLLRITGQGSFDALAQHIHGKPIQGAQPGSFLGKRPSTPDGKVQLAPKKFLRKLQELDAQFVAECESDGGLRLITKRSHHTHNSWTQNVVELTVGKMGQTNYLYMHPSDAEERNLEEGQIADVTSATSTLRVPIKLLNDLMPGTVALPHGWGHQHAEGLSVASKLSGVNVNLLAADGPNNVESLSGMVQLTGIPVSVTSADGELQRGSWSGR